MIIKKLNKPFLNLIIKGIKFRLDKETYNKETNFIYYNSYYEEIEDFIILGNKIKKLYLGLSFFIYKDKIGINFFAKDQKKHSNMVLETVKTKNKNLKVQYHKFDFLDKNPIFLNCYFFKQDNPLKSFKVKLLLK